jgi:hypothetical protein
MAGSDSPCATTATTSATATTAGDRISDDHPNAAGDRKATAEFVPLLNAAVNAWRAGQPIHALSIRWAKLETPSSFQFGWPSRTSRTYSVSATTNLALGFSEVTNQITAQPPTNTFVLPMARELQRFFRVREHSP